MQTVLTILGGIAAIILLSILMAYPTMLLWNELMPKIFGLIKIDIWEAWMLNALCGILFKPSSSSSKKD
jgi:hypothetical protein